MVRSGIRIVTLFSETRAAYSGFRISIATLAPAGMSTHTRTSLHQPTLSPLLQLTNSYAPTSQFTIPALPVKDAWSAKVSANQS